MATVTHRGKEVHTAGELPAIGVEAPDFILTGLDLQDFKLSDHRGKRVVLNIFPSIDTGTCAMSVRRFNAEASKLDNTAVICISRDLPFAQKRFCGAEGIENVVTGSEYKNEGFSSAYAVTLNNGPLTGLFSRCVVVIDEQGKVLHTEQVAETVDEPNYDAALSALGV